MGTSPRIKWGPVLEQAREIVNSYNTSVTLRQLFYRLVVEKLLPNSQNAYKRLSSVTAEARRDGDFPSLLDQTREIHRWGGFDSPADAVQYMRGTYRRNRDEGQGYSIYLGVEKKTMLQQLQSWFRKYGVAIVPLGGYSSQTYVDDVSDDLSGRDLPGVLIYAGDFDPSGMDILRDFEERCGAFDDVVRIALNPDQIQEYNLPVNPGKMSDSRAAGFIRDYGQLVQVELEALDPNTLKDLYEAALFEYYDTSTYEGVLTRETADMDRLYQLANGENDTDDDED
jgi:hypothetical protein